MRDNLVGFTGVLLPNSGARRKGVIESQIADMNSARRSAWDVARLRDYQAACTSNHRNRHTGRGDREILSLPNKPKLIHQRKAEVVFAKLGAIVRRKVDERDAAWRIKAHVAQINESELIVQSRSGDVTHGARRFEMEGSAAELIKRVEAVIIKLVAQIFGPDRPMAAEHIFDATATGPT